MVLFVSDLASSMLVEGMKYMLYQLMNADQSTLIFANLLRSALLNILCPHPFD